MKIVRSAFEAGRLFPGGVLAIGKFDAMHLGHRKLLDAARRRAEELRAPLVVVTFDASPEQHLRLFPYEPVLTAAEKMDALRASGADAVVMLPFDKRLACLSPEAFAEKVLALQLKPSCVFIGEDFCFGKDRAGHADTLEALGARLGFAVRSVPLATSGGEKITAARIRALLSRGRRADAEKLLGRKLP